MLIAGFLLLWSAVWCGRRQSLINRELVRQNDGLRAEIVLLPRIQEENQRLRATPSEQATLATIQAEREHDRQEITKLQRTLVEIERQRLELNQREAAAKEDEAQFRLADPNFYQTRPATGVFSLQAAQNVGAATPEALLETWLWAMRERQGELLEQLESDRFLISSRDILRDITQVSLEQKGINHFDKVVLRTQVTRSGEQTPGETAGIEFSMARAGETWKLRAVQPYRRHN
jgi:hypothetical protein